MPKTLTITPQLHDYVCAHGVREHPEQIRCRQETMELGRAAGMQIAPEQGAFMALFVRAIGAKRCLEIGTFTGYSALSVALALPEGGHLDALDISEEYMARARSYWAGARVSNIVTAHVGPALATLDTFLTEGRAGAYDFAFIDADKGNYDGYYERALKLLRQGGVVAIDNVLWSGDVADPSKSSPDTDAIRALNRKIRDDTRVDIAMATIADGLFLVRKR